VRDIDFDDGILPETLVEPEAEFRESYFFNTLEEGEAGAELKYFVLVIYDISENRRRNHLVKILKSFGVRVQKSAFEAILRPSKYQKLISKISSIPDKNDSIRVYKIRGDGAVTIFGDQFTAEEQEVIII
jgi:CRISPR-associated protein Cas2